MMTQGLTQDQMILGFAAFGVLCLIIFTVLWYTLLRNKGAGPRDHEVKAIPKTEEKPLKEKLEEARKPEPVAAKVEVPTPAPAPAPVEEKEVDLKKALRATEENIFGRIKSLFKANEPLAHLEEIEEVLYTSDLGPQTVQRLMEALEDMNKKEKADFNKVRDTLKVEMEGVFSNLPASTLQFAKEGPTVLMIVGVNGAGKTTSIGKLSAQFASQGKKVLVAAGDTFRAAAGGQLKVWTERAQVEIFSPEGVSDPSAVAFDAVSKAKAQGYDIVIIDTAGRLHTQENLMEELKKMKRVMTKVIPESPHEVIIVLDANSGQNALIQAKEYNKALTLTGAILTKMDGTAKGGVAVGLANELQIPIKFIGVGERIQDLRSFSPHEFVESIFS
ncbi:signal recognition particle-docking protein FtsY [Bdellovibrio sp. HCB337]|uniref:signal recognition particle-docking protein FtsY n=1 Tax=Bdellovibrio sp. HCB337 TaxID=3394358 RepID=UPI0039A75AD2